jgi:hypothetical protein
VLALPDAGQDTKRRVESICSVLQGAVVLGVIVPGMVVGVIIARGCEVDGVELTR